MSPTAWEARLPGTPSTTFWHERQEMVAQVVRAVARRRGLRAPDAEDLHSEVWLKLLSTTKTVDGYEGRGTLTAYLAAIAGRVLLDIRNRQLGKWRPTARSRKLGGLGIELDGMVRRDGFTPEQAAETLRCRGHEVAPHCTDSVRISAACRPRRRLVGMDLLQELPSRAEAPDHGLLHQESRRLAATAREALARALAAVPHEDRSLLMRRFIGGETVATIARREGRCQKALYRHLERVQSSVRRHVAQCGISPRSLRNILATCPGDLHGFLGAGAGFD